MLGISFPGYIALCPLLANIVASVVLSSGYRGAEAVCRAGTDSG